MHADTFAQEQMVSHIAQTGTTSQAPCANKRCYSELIVGEKVDENGCQDTSADGSISLDQHPVKRICEVAGDESVVEEDVLRARRPLLDLGDDEVWTLVVRMRAFSLLILPHLCACIASFPRSKRGWSCFKFEGCAFADKCFSPGRLI